MLRTVILKHNTPNDLFLPEGFVMLLKNSISCTFLLFLSACTTNYPMTVGVLGGAAIGAGAGAAIGRASTSVTVPNAMGVGAAIGVPAGILLAYTSDSIAKSYILAENDTAIAENYNQIITNQNYIEELRHEVAEVSPQGLPDEDSAQYIYMGPSLGNPWR